MLVLFAPSGEHLRGQLWPARAMPYLLDCFLQLRDLADDAQRLLGPRVERVGGEQNAPSIVDKAVGAQHRVDELEPRDRIDRVCDRQSEHRITDELKPMTGGALFERVS